MHIYSLICIRYHIFCIYIISHILSISHVLTDFLCSNVLMFRSYDVRMLWYSELPIFCMRWSHTDSMPYIFTNTAFTTYTAYTTYTAFNIWNLSTVIGVTPKHFCGYISEWDQTLIEYTYLLVRMTPMIIPLNLLKRFPWSGLVIKSPGIPFVGHHYTVTSFLFIRYLKKKNRMFMCLVILLPESLPFFSSSMALWLYY